MALDLVVENAAWVAAELPPDPDANAWCDVAYFRAYHARRLHKPVLDAATDAEIKAALVHGCELITYHVEWQSGSAVVDADQPLPLPRTGLRNREGRLLPSDAVPEVVRRANAEMALHLLLEDRSDEHATRGFGSLSFGAGESAEIDKADRTLVLPDSVIAMLWPLARVHAPPSPGRMRVDRVVRA